MQEQESSLEPTVKGRSSGSLLTVLGATVLSAASSFLVLLIVAPALGPAAYATFAVYWSALFMVVGVLFGVQQETTRAVAQHTVTAPDATQQRSSPMRFAAVLGAALLVLLAATGSLWSVPLLGEGHTSWAIPLAIAVAAYVGVAALNGILAGRGAWNPFAAIPVIDGVLRLVLVILVLWQDWGGTALAWAVAIPFPVSFLVVYLWQRRFVRAHGQVAESYRELAANSSRTVLASAATALLVNGFPVVLSIFGRSEPALLGAVVLALTLTRAPILMPLTALQSMLIAKFSSSTQSTTKFKAVVLLGILLATAVLATAAGIWGTTILVWIFGEGFALNGWLLAGLVAASGCLGLLTVTGASALAAEKHNVFAAGWVCGALVAVTLVAVLPIGIGTRTVVALTCGPLLGALVHLLASRAGRSAHPHDVILDKAE